MEDQMAKKLNAEEEMIVDYFKELNIKRTIALLLVALARRGELSSREIENITGLRQPEVSSTMRYLRKKDWVSTRDKKDNEGKGRPYHLYKLKPTLREIVDIQEKRILKQNQKDLDCIKKLKLIV